MQGGAEPTANGALARLFWGALDRLDYWIMHARLLAADALYGPFADGDILD
jgi:hypothetical protein